MAYGRNRPKQPDVVQTRVVYEAMRLCAQRGVHGLSLQLVADAAGVTKGGLLHHFPNKAALLEAMFDGLLLGYEEPLAAWMEQDAEPQGRFTRAYVRLTCEQLREGTAEAHGALLFALAAEPELTARWQQWVQRQAHHDGALRHHPSLELVRAACDGLWWQATAQSVPARGQLLRLEQQLLAWIAAC